MPNAMYVHLSSPWLGKKHRQWQLLACNSQTGESAQLTTLPDHSQLTQSYYKSVTDSSFVLAPWNCHSIGLCCAGLWVGEKCHFVDRVTQSTLDKHHASHMVLQKYAFHLLLEERFFLQVLTGNGTLACLPTPQVLLMTTWFHSFSYSFTD